MRVVLISEGGVDRLVGVDCLDTTLCFIRENKRLPIDLLYRYVWL